MKPTLRRAAFLVPALLLCACMPRPQAVQVWEGSGRILLRDQSYRMIVTVNDTTHDLRGTLENLSSGDRFNVTGTLLPVGNEAELTADITAQSGVKLKASILGIGVGDLALKADALLSGKVAREVFQGSLRVNGIAYPITLKRKQ